LNIQTPGRICLFGEHQDYLGLPVIAMAISLFSTVKGVRRKGNEVIIHKPDLNETESFLINDLTYTNSRDYFKSGIKVCIKEELKFSTGFEVEITSAIPIQAGCSSSSSIMVGWIHFLSQMADEPIDWQPDKIAQLAYKAEVVEFGEPGGMMDVYSTAMGGLIYLESEPNITLSSLKPIPGVFVLGDSLEQKNTLDILQRCKDNRLDISNKLKNDNPGFSLHSIKITDIVNFTKFLTENEMELLRGTVKNRDILREALSVLQSGNPDYELIGNLLTDHHAVLRDILKVSTPKIEAMLEAALKAGAFGGKINGSGGGGCMFAIAPDNPQAVAKAIEKVGGEATIIRQEEGTKIIF